MLKIRIKPIRNWIGEKNKYHQKARFELGYSDTLKIIDHELDKLGALDGSVEIEMFIKPEDVRLDGQLRASAKPFAPGVRLNFSIKTAAGSQTISYPCDTYDFWQDNLRAIAKSLENLRHVARYGVFKYQDMVERLALPSADGKLTTLEESAQFIAAHGDEARQDVLYDRTIFKKAYRRASSKLHPDNLRTGSHEDFARLVDAKNFLEKHFENS